MSAWRGLNPPYRTIVVDPPWEYPEGWPGWSETTRSPLPYSSLSVDEIACLAVSELAEPEAYLFLWTTSRYLEDAYRIVRGWRFTPRSVLVWCKEPRGLGPGGMFASTAEFVVVAQRIGPRSNGRKKMTSGVRIDRSWFVWPSWRVCRKNGCPLPFRSQVG